ncbi:MAG: hypothetical protein LBM20_05075 [Rikenellaceae bacterium]|jgi:hypothetical protein|nr:hypothetical protein [Rikenellaceae bacterium]
MSEKRDRQIDLLFIVLGLLILVLLFMPDPYADYRTAGYVGVAVFLAFLLVREIRRRRRVKKADDEPPL